MFFFFSCLWNPWISIASCNLAQIWYIVPGSLWRCKEHFPLKKVNEWLDWQVHTKYIWGLLTFTWHSSHLVISVSTIYVYRKQNKCSDMPNKHAANLINFWKYVDLHTFVKICTFINFWVFSLLKVIVN